METATESRNLRSIARHNKRWRQEEDNLIYENLDKPIGWLSEKLKRQPNSVQLRRKKLMSKVKENFVDPESGDLKDLHSKGKFKTHVRWENDEICYVAVTMENSADHIGKFLGRTKTSIYSMRTNINNGMYEATLREKEMYRDHNKWCVPKVQGEQIKASVDEIGARRHQIVVANEEAAKEAARQQEERVESAIEKQPVDDFSPTPNFTLPEGWEKAEIFGLTNYRSTTNSNGVVLKKLVTALKKSPERIVNELIKMKEGFYNKYLRDLGYESPFWENGQFRDDVKAFVKNDNPSTKKKAQPSKKHGNKLDQKKVDAVVELLKEGKSYQEITDATTVSTGSISTIKKKLFANMGEENSAPTFSANLPVSHLDKSETIIVELIAAGTTYDAIEEQTGANPCQIAKLKRRFFPEQMRDYKVSAEKVDKEEGTGHEGLEEMIEKKDQVTQSESQPKEVHASEEENQAHWFVTLANSLKERFGDVIKVREEIKAELKEELMAELKKEIKDELLKDLINVGRESVGNSEGGYDEFNKKATFEFSILWGAFKIKRKNIS